MTTRRRRELALQKEIVAFIKRVGGAARVVHQDRYTTVGDADVYGCYRGRMLQLEVKEPGNKPTGIQKLRRAEWRRAGAIAKTVYSVRQVALILKKIPPMEEP